ncbi:MAG TPA: aldo/keto reductase, partial [Bacteroidia bacterium]|nr:aldo/keto reductase [Bacteroidia bacterium]
MFRDLQPDLSAASWAVRFAASQKGVLMVLSGMSNIEQLRENISYMIDIVPLNEAELSVV